MLPSARVTLKPNATAVIFAAPPGSGTYSVLLRNMSAHVVDLGDEHVIAGQGFPLQPEMTQAIFVPAGDVLYAQAAEESIVAVAATNSMEG